MAEMKAPIKIDGFKCIDDIVQAVLNYTYKGKTLKEWADRISKPLTNGDRFRSMTDEELAEEMSVRLSEDCLMCPVLEADCPVWDKTKNAECKDAMLDWLRQEVKSDG